MRIRVALAALPLVLLAACGGGSTASTTDTTANPSDTQTGVTTATTTPPVQGPTVPAATALAAPVPADKMPKASGKFGEKPTLTFPKGDPVTSLQRVILSAGTGPETKKGDWLVTNYLGQIWGGKVFDNSYDRHSTTAFQIGIGKVVPGWDVGLVGVKVGSRVMLNLPPQDGYGMQGNPQAGITGTDTLVFVVDIVGAYGENVGGQTDAVPQPQAKGGPQVKGALGKQPTVTVPKGLAEPKAAKVTVIAKGTGPKVVDGQVLAQYVAVDWTGQPGPTTWPGAAAEATGGGTGPQQLPVQAGTPFVDLKGVPVGSRVLLEIPSQQDPSSGQTTPSFAVAVDIIVQTSTGQ